MHLTRHLVVYCSCLALAFSTLSGQAIAVLDTITDTTPGTAINDGTINTGEYAGFSGGINSSFGNVIGSNSELHVDSSIGGALNFGLVSGGGALNDVAVIYIDSVAGGLSSTSTIEDTGDAGRAAISGDGEFGGESEVTFASGFQADYAITLAASFSGVFSIGSDGTLTFVDGNDLTPANNTTAGAWEFELTLAEIGLSAGDSFDYVATYLNPGNAFRSDEFHGISSTPSGSPGANPISLDDFNTFVSVPEPSAFLFGGLVCSVLAVKYSRTRNRA